MSMKTLGDTAREAFWFVHGNQLKRTALWRPGLAPGLLSFGPAQRELGLDTTVNKLYGLV